MTKWLTDDDLAQMRTLVPTECAGLLAMVDAVTDELRMRRKGDVLQTIGVNLVEAKKWAADWVMSHNDFAAKPLDPSEPSLVKKMDILARAVIALDDALRSARESTG